MPVNLGFLLPGGFNTEFEALAFPHVSERAVVKETSCRSAANKIINHFRTSNLISAENRREDNDVVCQLPIDGCKFSTWSGVNAEEFEPYSKVGLRARVFDESDASATLSPRYNVCLACSNQGSEPLFVPINTTCTDARATVIAKISTLLAFVNTARQPASRAEKTMMRPNRTGVLWT